MNEIEVTIKYSKLFDLYSGLLSDRQKEILEEYFNYNLSLSEIADNKSISRAAVEDALKKGMKKLDHFENILNLAKKKENILKITANLKQKSIYIEDIEEIERNL